MTVKELVQFSDKSDKQVRRWIHKAGQNVQSILDKMSNCKNTGKAADFTIDEVKAILLASSMSKDAVSVIMQNARVNSSAQSIIQLKNDVYVTKDDLKIFAKDIVSEIFKQLVPIIQQPIKQLDFVQNYYTVKGYMNKIGEQITISEAINLGKKATALSRDKGFEIRKVDDERFGHVNSYSVEVLKTLFEM